MEVVLNVICAIGIPTIAIALIYVGRKLQILDEVGKAIKKIKNNVLVISNSLIESSVEFDHGKLETFSPVRLTDEGMTHLEKIGFIKIFSDHKEDFLDIIKTEIPKTKYDVENNAKKSVLILMDKDYFQPIKEFLYENPKESKQELVRIAGTYVRDKFLEENKDIVK